jgi:23S rRNA (uracil1939-C5)-methyltransferase
LNTTICPVAHRQELQLKIKKVAYGGKGIGYYNDYLIFVNNVLPGDVIRAKIMKRKPNYAEAQLLEIVESSPMRQKADCPYFRWCGGCTWQDIAYPGQIELKREHVIECIRHIAQLDNIPVMKTLPSAEIWGYRNKMEFSFSNRRWLLPAELTNENMDRSFALGLHLAGTHNKIIDIDNCLLQSKAANDVLQLVDQYCRKNRLEPYDIRSHTGYLRFLVIRESRYDRSIMVNIVTSEDNPEQLMPLANMLSAKNANIIAVVNNIHSGKAQIALGEKEIILTGRSYLLEKLMDMYFRISANSFFQTNTRQAVQLYKMVLDFTRIKATDIVWDFYCGTGTISLFLAREAKYVYGFEWAESAVLDARTNAAINKISNVTFITGDLLKNIGTVKHHPDIIVIDPPRSGIHPKVCNYINQSGIERIVYVSCNPATLARDIKIMKEKYTLIKIQPIDMFPHTYHIESVALLVRMDSNGKYSKNGGVKKGREIQ